MKKGDLVIFNTQRGTSPLEDLLGVLMQDSFKHGNGYENARVYFANAPKWPERTISVKWLRLVNASR
jgi:hypothetical protein